MIPLFKLQMLPEMAPVVATCELQVTGFKFGVLGSGIPLFHDHNCRFNGKIGVFSEVKESDQAAGKGKVDCRNLVA